MKDLKHVAWTAIVLLALAGCRKEKEEPAQLSFDYTTAQDNATADDYFNDMMQQVDGAATDEGLRDTDDPCAPTVTIDLGAMPHTMTVVFGSTNCTALNGRMRRGVLFVTFTGAYGDPGTVITITPQNYYVNDHHVEGSKTVTNMGENTAHQPYFNVTVDGTITAPDGSWTATHHSQRVRTWTGGSDTPLTWTDDAYTITGTGNGVNRNGLPYTMAITNALHVNWGCPYITQGTLTLTPQDLPTRTIDYGNGTCDGTFTVSVSGYTFTVTIG